MIHEMLQGIMSDEFDGLDATEKTGIKAALNRCRALAAQIARQLRNEKPEHFVDKLSVADFWVSLEVAANLLWQPITLGSALVAFDRSRLALRAHNGF
jgi:hypothetical protein